MESSSIFLLMLVTGVTTFSHDPVASRKAQDAYARYSGIDDTVSSYAKKLQNEAEKETPEEVRFYIGGAVYLSKTIIDKKIVVKWTF
jgi:hypothetical protein